MYDLHTHTHTHTLWSSQAPIAMYFIFTLIAQRDRICRRAIYGRDMLDVSDPLGLWTYIWTYCGYASRFAHVTIIYTSQDHHLICARHGRSVVWCCWCKRGLRCGRHMNFWCGWRKLCGVWRSGVGLGAWLNQVSNEMSKLVRDVDEDEYVVKKVQTVQKMYV